MIVLKAVLFLGLVVLALVFSYSNQSTAELNLFGHRYRMPLFALVLASFGTGFLLAYLFLGVKLLLLKGYTQRVGSGLRQLWTGYPAGARREFSRLLSREEVLPLYMEASKRVGEEPSVYLQEYSLGIAETYTAVDLLKRDESRARELLEKALGKNWNNLTARRLLVSLYFLGGELQKALDLQRSLIKDCDKALRDKERRVLASLLALAEEKETLRELEELPLTPLSARLLIEHSSDNRKRKLFLRAVEENLHNETLFLLIANRNLTPEIVEEVEALREKINRAVLYLLYSELGMGEKLRDLERELPQPVKTLVRKLGSGNALPELMAVFRLFECKTCGKEYADYTPVCKNCYDWNTLKIKEGEGYADRLREQEGQA